MVKKVFTQEVLASIPQMVADGMNRKEIAARIGCTPGSLSMRCSQYKISLRGPQRRKRKKSAKPRPAKHLTIKSSVILSHVARSHLRQRAEARGVTEAALVMLILETIARDNLYDAVLDDDKKSEAA